MPPEHRAAVEGLLAQLRATAVYQAIARSRPPAQPPRVPNEVLATFLLALPDSALAPLSAPARAALASLRTPEQLGPLLADEIAALRAQMTTLRQWQSTA